MLAAAARGARATRVLRAIAACWAAASLLVAAAPVAAFGETRQAPPELDAAAWILLDARDGDRLAAHAAAAPRPIASTTKLMTAYLALQDLDLGEEVTVPPYDAAPAESVAGLVAGESLSVRDLLLAMMLPSANDAAETVALGIAPTEDAFVARMNDAAAELGLSRTSYANPIGLDDPLNYSSAADLAKLTLALREDRRFRKIVARPKATLRSGSVEREVLTRNTLLLSDPSVDGVKTGHTTGAGYVLVASAKREGVPLVSVVLGASSEAGRDEASEQLLDYGYSLYAPRSPFRAGEELASADVSYEEGPLPLLARRPLRVTARADQDLEADVRAPASVEGPIERGERLGTATVSLDGEVVGTVPLLAARAVAEQSVIDRVGGPLAAAAILIAGVVILIGLALVLRRLARSSENRNAARRRG